MSDSLVIDLGQLRSTWALPDLDGDGDKHQRGTVVVVAGATATPGAALLPGLAALRVGAGRLSIVTAETTAPALGVAVPEAAVVGLPVTPSGDMAAGGSEACQALVGDADAVLLGPGMQDPEDARRLLEVLIAAMSSKAVVVLDALALTCGLLHSKVMRSLSARCIITPNREEARRLLDDEIGPTDTAVAVALAERFGVVALFGSAVAAPDGRCYRTPHGNVGLGTSGSGDVLAGIVVGLAARGASPLQAALWGVTLHSSAGDRLAHRVAPVGYLARELLDELPHIVSRDPSEV